MNKRPKASYHVKRGDLVEVTTGDYKGVQGTISRVITKTSKVIVDGVPKGKKTVRPSQEKPEGGFIDFDRKIHVSNVKKVEKKEVPVKKKAAKQKSK
jgi:large subunit ribosomal protein L24